MSSRKKEEGEFPFGLVDTASYISDAVVAMEPTFHGVRCVGHSIAQSRVIDYTILLEDIGPERRFSRRNGSVFERSSTDLTSTHLSKLRKWALEYGASPEAIRLLNAHTAFSQKELNIMAGKLSKKADTKKAAPAKTTAKKAEAPAKKKGNPEALAKARAARAEAGPDTRKITVLKKDHGARAGSKRAELLNSIFKAKTVQAAVEAGTKKSDVAWAAREGYISLA